MGYCYADIIIPVAIKGRFTYIVPENMAGKIGVGSAVIVSFGKRKLYTGIVCRLHEDAPPENMSLKPVERVFSEQPVVNEKQLRHWRWIADYYMCSEGEIMKAAIPSAMITDGYAGSPVEEKYKPKEQQFVKLKSAFTGEDLNAIMDKLVKAPKQYGLLNEYLYLSKYSAEGEEVAVSKKMLLDRGKSTSAILNALCDKNILAIYNVEVSRLKETEEKDIAPNVLSHSQQVAYESIKRLFAEKNVVLLHGVTSSGKTEIYIHLIEEQLKQGKQVLYLLPEIALTTQIINRLRCHFGNRTGVYHSRFNDAERVEIWNKVAEKDPLKGYRLILGVRSSIFLPFDNLGMIIVDEEHDSSYKQQEPAPRYNARDAAIVLAEIHHAKTLLGSASPSIESYANAYSAKYGLVEIKERFGTINLPDIILADTREAYRKKRMVSHFTPELLDAVGSALANHEQVLLFRNRRGFSPYIECSDCGWIPACEKCAVKMTYHKSINSLVCHYCGNTVKMPSQCGNCGSTALVTRGYGTEKLEDEIKFIFPQAVVERMDQDTTRGKNSFSKIIKDFEDHKTDILVGTQMISKGLDFENLTVVGILNADNMLNFPDFRAHERSFQMMEQVSGRAGRRRKQGKVIIQTSDPEHSIIRLVVNNDYLNMFKMQMEERNTFFYPPYCRLIKISLKHKDKSTLNHFSNVLANELRSFLGQRILGPEDPLIYKVQLWYIKTIIIKIEKNKNTGEIKKKISDTIEYVEKLPGASSLRIIPDVDPY